MSTSKYDKSLTRSIQKRAWPTPVTEPPFWMVLNASTGEQQPEELLLTGSFVCDEEAWLTNHQIDLIYASYCPQTCRFEPSRPHPALRSGLSRKRARAGAAASACPFAPPRRSPEEPPNVQPSGHLSSPLDILSPAL